VGEACRMRPAGLGVGRGGLRWDVERHWKVRRREALMGEGSVHRRRADGGPHVAHTLLTRCSHVAHTLLTRCSAAASCPTSAD